MRAGVHYEVKAPSRAADQSDDVALHSSRRCQCEAVHPRENPQTQRVNRGRRPHWVIGTPGCYHTALPQHSETWRGHTRPKARWVAPPNPLQKLRPPFEVPAH